VIANPVRARTAARVNIMGEHTDYNGGFVLPMATVLFTNVMAVPRNDRVVRVKSEFMGETQEFGLDNLQPQSAATWIDYAKGVAAELQIAGAKLRGANLVINSDIPLGAGLSSSASLELSIARALLAIADEEFIDTELALICQRAEHNYAHVQCGIMDQYALACAQKDHAVLLDCRSLRAEQVALPSNVGFILTDCGVRHSLADGEYNVRAEECAAAVALLKQDDPAIEQLRDVRVELLEANKHSIGDVLFRRCRHVLSENKRVHDVVQALQEGDIPNLGALITACHASLRDDFEVSCDELNALVDAANSSDHIQGSRMVGAGFGGCVLSICEHDEIDVAADEIRKNYAAVSGAEVWQHKVSAVGPSAVISKS
jgi:galactokinase